MYLDFLIKVTEEAEFFREFSDDYYEIYQRSTSLNEIDKARLKRIIWTRTNDFLKNSEPYFKKFLQQAKQLLQ